MSDETIDRCEYCGTLIPDETHLFGLEILCSECWVEAMKFEEQEKCRT